MRVVGLVAVATSEATAVAAMVVEPPAAVMTVEPLIEVVVAAELAAVELAAVELAAASVVRRHLWQHL